MRMTSQPQQRRAPKRLSDDHQHLSYQAILLNHRNRPASTLASELAPGLERGALILLNRSQFLIVVARGYLYALLDDLKSLIRFSSTYLGASLQVPIRVQAFGLHVQSNRWKAKSIKARRPAKAWSAHYSAPCLHLIAI